MTVNELLKLKQSVETLSNEAIKAEAVVDAAKKALDESFGLSSLEAAELANQDRQIEIAVILSEIKKMKSDIDTNFGDLLRLVDG